MPTCRRSSSTSWVDGPKHLRGTSSHRCHEPRLLIGDDFPHRPSVVSRDLEARQAFALLTVGCLCILSRISARVPMVTGPIWWAPSWRRGLSQRCHSPEANISQRHLGSGSPSSGILLPTRASSIRQGRRPDDVAPGPGSARTDRTDRTGAVGSAVVVTRRGGGGVQYRLVPPLPGA